MESDILIQKELLINKKHRKLARVLSDNSAIMTTAADPEADTRVFYSSRGFIDQHGSINANGAVIIDCPETDLLTWSCYEMNAKH